jgi:DNA polymerase-3 subunit epsilon
VSQALEYLKTSLPTFAVVENVALPKREHKQGVILMEKGRFYGMGYVPATLTAKHPDELKPHLTPYPENGYIRGLVYQYATKYPERRREFAS